MTRRHYSAPLRLDGLDAWITREPPPDEPVPCKACGGEGAVPECELEDYECTCFGLAKIDCEVRCPCCEGRGWL